MGEGRCQLSRQKPSIKEALLKAQQSLGFENGLSGNSGAWCDVFFINADELMFIKYSRLQKERC